MNAEKYIRQDYPKEDVGGILTEEEIIGLMESYHQAKSKEEAEERYMEAVMFITSPVPHLTSSKERAEKVEESLRIASGKKES